MKVGPRVARKSEGGGERRCRKVSPAVPELDTQRTIKSAPFEMRAGRTDRDAWATFRRTFRESIFGREKQRTVKGAEQREEQGRISQATPAVCRNVMILINLTQSIKNKKTTSITQAHRA